jgi:hypothetical protein
MKFTKEMQDRIIKWVELNGLYPQPCGATVQELCKACGFSDETYSRWTSSEKNVEFVERLTRAREKFASTVEVGVVNSLVKAAKGVDFTRIKEEAKADKVTEYYENGKKKREYTGELKTVKAVRETVYYPPNVEAAKFVLTNIAPERWKAKQEVTHQGDGGPINISVSSPDIAEALDKVLAAGAQPRQPKAEE